MFYPISSALSYIRSNKSEFLRYWALLVLGSMLGIMSVYLLVNGYWQLSMVLIFILPAAILIVKYPLLSLIIWLLLNPFLMTTPTAAERMVYWLIHRALPPATVGFLLISHLLRIRRLPKISPAEVAMIAYLILSQLSVVFFNPIPVATTFVFYDRFFIPMCLYWVVRFSRLEEKDLHRLLPVVLFLGLSQAAIGILSWTAPQILREEWLQLAGIRTTGSLVAYSVYTTTMVFSGLVVLHAALNRKPGLAQMVYIFVFFLAIYCVFISFSRGSWLAGVFVLLGLFFIYPRFMIKTLFIVVPVASLLVGWIFSNEVQFAYQRLNSTETALSRLPVTYASVRMFEIKPLFGWGYGNFGYYDRQFQQRVGDLVNAEKDEASHNLYLTMLAEQGLIGFILFITPLLWWLVQSIVVIPSMPAEGFWSRKLLLLLWLVILNHFIVNNFSHMLVVFGLGMWWITLGIIANMVSAYPKANKQIPKPVSKSI